MTGNPMKKIFKKTIFSAAALVAICLLLQMASLSYYYWSCMREKSIEITCFNKTPCEITVPLKYVQYNTANFREILPVYTREKIKYNIHCVPEKNILFLTFHRRVWGGFGCHRAMYKVPDPSIRQRLIKMWKNFK
jgi:hypothetical protein